MIQLKSQPMTRQPARSSVAQPIATRTSEQSVPDSSQLPSSINNSIARVVIGLALWGASAGAAIGSAWSAYQRGDLLSAVTTFTIMFVLVRGATWLTVRI